MNKSKQLRAICEATRYRLAHLDSVNDSTYTRAVQVIMQRNARTDTPKFEAGVNQVATVASRIVQLITARRADLRNAHAAYLEALPLERWERIMLEYLALVVIHNGGGNIHPQLTPNTGKILK